jgi:GNAT superfamily N-acetyltransferase/anti-sigma regulatory factor (Ser/Thr protein kinase)
MIASLTLSSDERLRPLAGGFGLEFARAVGVAEDAAPGLADVLGEAVRFVCEQAYPGDASGRIEVTLEPDAAGIRVTLHDWGRPLTSVREPAEGPPALAPLRARVGAVRLINLGADGKRLSFVWEAAHATPAAPAAAEAPAPVRDAAQILVRDGTPEDAEPIAQLLYENYALSYVHPDFYRPLWLREELRSGRVLSTIAVDGGEIVGHHALIPDAVAPAAETGVAVVAGAYRGLGIFGRLGEHTLQRARARGLAALYGRAVTIHPYSQRAELAHGYREAALCLGAQPAAVTMRDIPTAGRRTALMVSFRPLRPDARRGSLPGRYRERLLETYARLELPPPTAGDPEGAARPLTVTHDEHAGTATITLGGWDGSIAADAVAAVRRLLAEHVDVVYADLDLATIADPDAAVDALRAHGFSYAGLWLHGPGDDDHLRLQRLNSTDVELDMIATASPAGAELVDFVLADLST